MPGRKGDCPKLSKVSAGEYDPADIFLSKKRA
jgi:hypothetical protein